MYANKSHHNIDCPSAFRYLHAEVSHLPDWTHTSVRNYNHRFPSYKMPQAADIFECAFSY